MFSKLNCFKFQTNCDHTKDTKLQKYLRERNAKILEKCFNVKTEKEPYNSDNGKLPGQPINGEPYQPLENNISVITAKSEDINLPTSATKEVNNQKKTTSETSSVKAMDHTKTTAGSQSQRKQRPKTAPNHSSGSGSLKTFRNHQTARSSGTTNWKSPFTSAITTSVRHRLPNSQQSSEFAYDLSRDELKFAGRFCSPMKPVTEAERLLLKNGERKEYLTQRYEHSPVAKYNYPEATSWRIGWLQRQQ